VKQNATHLLWLTAAILGSLSLPIVFGLIAVLREKD
jgi:hypothetical protein